MYTKTGRVKTNMIRHKTPKTWEVAHKTVKCNLCGLIYADINSYNDHIIWCVKDHQVDGDAYMIKKNTQEVSK